MAYSVFKFQLEVVTNLLLYANFYSLFIIVYCAIHLIRQLADIVSYINPKSCHTCLVSAAKMLKEVSTYAGPFHADQSIFSARVDGAGRPHCYKSRSDNKHICSPIPSPILVGACPACIILPVMPHLDRIQLIPTPKTFTLTSFNPGPPY